MQEDIFAELHITYADGRQQVIPLKQSTINLGRVPPSDVVLADPQVSRQHARLLFEVDRVSLVDLNSRNGTFVGTAKLPPNVPRELPFGQAFRIGPFMLQLQPAPRPVQQVQSPDQPAASSDQPAEPALVRAAELRLPPEPPVEPPSGSSDGSAPSENGAGAYAGAFGLPADASRYLRYLPPLYQDQEMLGRFLLGFEGVLTPIEQTVDNLDLYLDPVTTPAYFLDRLASWLGMTLDEKWPLEKRRVLVAEAVELYRRRGTRASLSRHLEIYTDLVPEISEPAERPHHFHVVLRVPPGRAVDRVTVERIIQANQPAHTTYSLDIVAKA